MLWHIAGASNVIGTSKAGLSALHAAAPSLHAGDGPGGLHAFRHPGKCVTEEAPHKGLWFRV